MQKDKITALLMEALDYDMGPVPRSNIDEAIALLNPEGKLEFVDDLTGVPWLCVLVPVGARYGLFDERQGQRVLENKSAAMVEFWDRRYEHDFEHRAQFVARYYVETLLAPPTGRGLDLYGGQPGWQLSPRSFSLVRQWLQQF